MGYEKTGIFISIKDLETWAKYNSARIAELEAALKPFAEYGILKGFDGISDDYQISKQITAKDIKMAKKIYDLRTNDKR